MYESANSATRAISIFKCQPGQPEPVSTPYSQYLVHTLSKHKTMFRSYKLMHLILYVHLDGMALQNMRQSSNSLIMKHEVGARNLQIYRHTLPLFVMCSRLLNHGVYCYEDIITSSIDVSMRISDSSVVSFLTWLSLKSPKMVSIDGRLGDLLLV